ncbi:MAG: endolytic transglycosylase MltG [Rhodobacteraceae bacterium]|nr:endolytic transglycosylase MltG [Paracoccaceae bacterium]
MWKHIVANALTLAIVILIGFGVYIVWAQAQYKNPGPLAEAICVQVRPGENMRGLSEDLVDRGAVANGTFFRLGAEYTDKSSLLKAGSFLVPEGSSMEEIVDIVTRGGRSTCGVEVLMRIGVASSRIEVRELDPSTNRFEVQASFNPAEEVAPEEFDAAAAQNDTRFRIALAEGVTSWQITEALNDAAFLEGEIAEVPPEGSLAPDSYEVRAGASRPDLVAQMQDRQAARLDAAWQNRADDLPLSTPEEALILASIIEKETGIAEERRTVSSVFVNRLNTGMRLQTDPTVIYGVTEGRGTLGRGLRQSELRGETPWNTYVIDGLPPTPIANPGQASIEAALNPDETDYIFFVADGTGGHAFATNLADHNRNVAEWRRIEAERANQ